MTNNKDEKLCPYCNGQGKMWCAACGKYGDHGSATCPTITHNQEVPSEEKPPIPLQWIIEKQKEKLSALTLKLQEAEKSWELWKGRFDKIHNIVSKDGDCTVTEVIERVSALTQENKELKEALEWLARNNYILSQATNSKRWFVGHWKDSKYIQMGVGRFPLEAIQSAQSMERSKEGEV